MFDFDGIQKQIEIIRSDVAKGAYSAIVYKEGDSVIAEDRKGRKIAEGVAGQDDASIIQSALDAYKAVYLAEGTYTITQPIKLNDYNALIGAGASYDSVKLISNGTTEVIDLHTNSPSRVKIENLFIDGNWEAIGINARLTTKKATQNIIRDIYIYRTTTGVDITNQSDNTLENVIINAFSQYGFVLESSGGINRAYHLKIFNGAGDVQGIAAIKFTQGILTLNDITIELKAGVEASEALITLDGSAYLYISDPFLVARDIPVLYAKNNVIPFVRVFGGYIGIETGGNLSAQDVIKDDGTGYFNRLFLIGSYAFNNKSGAGGKIINATVLNCWILGKLNLSLVDTTKITRLHYNADGYDQIYDYKTGTHEFIIPTTPPSTAVKGKIYFDATTGTLYIYDGTTWKSVTLT